jgi:hypothetical protein
MSARSFFDGRWRTMPNTRFAHRVAVHQGFAVFYKPPAAAQHLIDSGLAKVRRKAAKVIVEIELTSAATGYMQGQVGLNCLGLRPGSFGIQVERYESGRCFAHRYCWASVVGDQR